MNIILIISLLIGVGFIFGKLAQKIGLPTVSGYLIAGLLVGLLPLDLASNDEVYSTISEITLSFVAFGIGSEFVFSKLRQSGWKVFIITTFEVLGAILVVGGAIYLLIPTFFPNQFSNTERFIFSLVIGSMSAATAPTATIMVIRQFRTKGPVTDTILPVAALDDVLGIVAFGLALPVARMLIPGSTIEPTLWNFIQMPVVEVFGSLLIGGILGFLLTFVSKEFDPRDEIQVKTIFFILVGLGVSKIELGDLTLSPLLVNIMLGTILANYGRAPDRSFRAIGTFVPVFYILFFAIAGARLDLAVLSTVGLIGIIYVLARAAGKIGGSYLGATIAKADNNIRKYLGFALLPQGGISIGLSLLVVRHLPANISTPIVTIILFSILIYESTGPIFAKLALKYADELYKAELVDEEALDLEDNMI